MLKNKLNNIGFSVIFGLVLSLFFGYSVLAANYSPQAIIESKNLLIKSSAISIYNFYYNIYSLPDDTSVKIQFSEDGSSWYSASGVLDAWTDLNTIGGANIDLKNLYWSGSSFYYKLQLNASSDKTKTPSIEDIRLDYNPSVEDEGVEALAVDNNYNVGIGTSIPREKLHILGNTLTTGSTYSLDGFWLDSDRSVGLYKSKRDIRFKSNNDLLTIKSNGNVGIGTTEPKNNLEVFGSVAINGPADSSDLIFKIGEGSTGLMVDLYSNQNFISNSSFASINTRGLKIKQKFVEKIICGLDFVTGRGSDNKTYGTVIANDGKCWLDRNLGATNIPSSFSDPDAIGYSYQWGRESDGHQLPNSGMTETLSLTPQPGHSYVIFRRDSSDWLYTQDDNLWQGVDGVNNPCPQGFRVPTRTEWVNLMVNEQISDSASAYSSNLKLMTSDGWEGNYWSSTPSGYRAEAFNFGEDSADFYNGSRIYLNSVRCVQD